MLVAFLMTLTTVAFMISALLTQHLSRPQAFIYIIDIPNDRSLHQQPTPLSGGIAVLVAFILTSIVACAVFIPQDENILWIGATVFVVAAISLLDDYRTVAAKYRLLVHFSAAILLLFQTDLWIETINFADLHLQLSSFWQVSLSLLFVIWMINLYNFMDGMDGFAGGMAVMGFGSFALLGWFANDISFTVLNLLIASAATGFLVFNFPPARIFMGDVGSSSLGLLAAAFSLWGNRDGIFPLWIAILLFSPFIIDATVTLLKRVGRGEKVWQAHRTHYYQRLVQLGWGHKRTVLCEYGLMFACALSAIIANFLSPSVQITIMLIWLGIYAILMNAVDRLEQQRITSRELNEI
jgi:UDP-N-acetylmuramyl pentapeptide phosphotransferase/UDP-N-acetylglucosamine-1-phosphate transferase